MNSEPEPNKYFWLGNAVLTLALVMLLFMGQLWTLLGAWAMGLWAAVAAIGTWLLMQGKGGPREPD